MRFGQYTTALIAASTALAAAPSASAQITGKMVNPDVMIVLDTSRSMGWLKDPLDTDGDEMSASARDHNARTACLAANQVTGTSQRTSWQQLLDVMLGSIDESDFHCFVETPSMRPALQSDTVATDVGKNTSEYREANNSHMRAVSCYDPRTSDRGDWNTSTGQCVGETPDPTAFQTIDNNFYCRNEDVYTFVDESGETHRRCYDYNPLSKSRSSNGILERYRTLARFGVMTYDNKMSPLSDTDAHNGWFDYGQTRKWNCKRWGGDEDSPGAGCKWNAGARDANVNAVGRMVSISDDLEASNQQVRDVFNTTEPLNCSPVGALIDDVGYYFYNTSSVKPAATGTGSDIYFSCRPRLVIFIGDGAPNQAFEFPSAYCNDTDGGYYVPGAPDHPVTPSDPTADPVYSCPWHASNTEVEQLHDMMENLASSFGDDMSVDPVYFVVIGFNAGDKGDVDCSSDPTWEVTTSECIPPDPRCIQLEVAADPSECVASIFRTPRQFLNDLALTGWPSAGASSPYDIQPPWRDGTSDLCTDETADGGVDDSCGGEEGDTCYGGSGSDEECNGAIFVEGPEELSAVLDLLLSTLTATTATRTDVVTTDQTVNNFDEDWSTFSTDTDQVAQYEFNTGFQVRGGQPWKGFLYRSGYACSDDENDSGAGAVGTVDAFHSWLNLQTTRNIYTARNADISGISYGTASGFRRGFDVLQKIDGTGGEVTDCDVGGPTSGTTPVCQGKWDIVEVLKKHLYGEAGSAREGNRLADIYNSTPAILGPPVERINIGSYLEFQSASYTKTNADGTPDASKHLSDRPPVLYVGTNDGVLHAFNVWSSGTGTSLTTTQVEDWGYVPNVLLGDLTKQFPISWTVQNDTDGTAVGYTVSSGGMYQHVFGVDGSPVSADLRLYRSASATATDTNNYWRSLVIGGLGKGGVGYYALDVTEEEAKPRFRWEISESSPAYNDAADWLDETGDFVFGMSLGKPALTYVYVMGKPPGDGSVEKQELAVAILPGGYKSDEEGGVGVSTGVAVVRAADGKKLRYLTPTIFDEGVLTANASDLCQATKDKNYDPRYLVAQLVGEPAVPYPLRSLTVNDEAFIGDDRGRLWRLDMSSTNPGSWCIDLFFDSLLTTHFPYKDCIESPACCPEKATDPGAACDEGTILSLSSDDNWSIDACTGEPCDNVDYPFPRIPIVSAPTILQDEDRNNIILFGTGQLDGVEALDHHRIFSLKQSISYQVTGNRGDGDTAASTSASAPTINWWLGEPIPTGGATGPYASDLADEILALSDAAIPDDGTVYTMPTTVFDGTSLFNGGEKLLGRITVFNQVAYFTTFIPVDQSSAGSVIDACNSGGSRIWGVTYSAIPTGGSFGQLAVEGSTEAHAVFNEYPNDLLSGLKLVRRPACSGQASFSLVTQKATTTGATGTASAPEGSQSIQSVSLTLQQPSRGFTTVGIDSWSLVFN